MPLPDPDHDLPTHRTPARFGRLALVLLVLAVAGALAAVQWIALPMLQDLLNASPATPPTTANVQLVRTLFLLLGGLGTLVGLILLQQAVAIRRSGEAPPNGWWLWRETFIARGERAKRLARLTLWAGLVLGGLCIGLSAFILDALDKAAPIALRSGVTVIEQGAPRQPKP